MLAGTVLKIEMVLYLGFLAVLPFVVYLFGKWMENTFAVNTEEKEEEE